MSYKRVHIILWLGVCCGTLLAFAYINPYVGKISVSELVLQLSGSRGNIPLGFSLPELLSYSTKLFPYFLFEMYAGTNLYRHFCTASVYVFSRTSNRIVWYFRECIAILCLALIYQIMLLSSAIGVTSFRYGVIWTNSGFCLLIIHTIIFCLWLFSMTLLVNVLAIQFGSGNSFNATIGGQIVLISLIAFLKPLESNHNVFSFFIKINPITRMVIGWQSSSIRCLDETINAPWDVLSLGGSVLYFFALAVIILLIGVYLVNKRDLIIADPEFGGM